MLLDSSQTKLEEPPVTVNWDVAPSQIDKFPEMVGALLLDTVISHESLLLSIFTELLLALTTETKFITNVPVLFELNKRNALLLPTGEEIVELEPPFILYVKV